MRQVAIISYSAGAILVRLQFYREDRKTINGRKVTSLLRERRAKVVELLENWQAIEGVPPGVDTLLVISESPRFEMTFELSVTGPTGASNRANFLYEKALYEILGKYMRPARSESAYAGQWTWGSDKYTLLDDIEAAVEYEQTLNKENECKTTTSGA
jgi:hypothetical protein